MCEKQLKILLLRNCTTQDMAWVKARCSLHTRVVIKITSISHKTCRLLCTTKCFLTLGIGYLVNNSSKSFHCLSLQAKRPVLRKIWFIFVPCIDCNLSIHLSIATLQMNRDGVICLSSFHCWLISKFLSMNAPNSESVTKMSLVYEMGCEWLRRGIYPGFW